MAPALAFVGVIGGERQNMLPRSPQTQGIPWQTPLKCLCLAQRPAFRDGKALREIIQGHPPFDRHGKSRQRGKGRAEVGRGEGLRCPNQVPSPYTVTTLCGAWHPTKHYSWTISSNAHGTHDVGATVIPPLVGKKTETLRGEGRFSWPRPRPRQDWTQGV